MAKKFLTRLVIVTYFVLFPTLSFGEVKEKSSSDIIAEIEFLESVIPQRSSNLRLGNSDERAFLTYLSSYAICEGWSFQEYKDFVESFEIAALPFVPAGRTFNIRLQERSYKSRFDNGCQDYEESKNIVDAIFGDANLLIRVNNAIDERRDELIRRTLGISK